MLDQLLLILMIIEMPYTVQVSFREHVPVPEPFVLVLVACLVSPRKHDKAAVAERA